MVDARSRARGNREVYARIVEHPLGVILVDLNRRSAEESAIKAHRFVEAFHTDVDMRLFHLFRSLGGQQLNSSMTDRPRFLSFLTLATSAPQQSSANKGARDVIASKWGFGVEDHPF